jgi:hypothetical protein
MHSRLIHDCYRFHIVNLLAAVIAVIVITSCNYEPKHVNKNNDDRYSRLQLNKIQPTLTAMGIKPTMLPTSVVLLDASRCIDCGAMPLSVALRHYCMAMRPDYIVVHNSTELIGDKFLQTLDCKSTILLDTSHAFYKLGFIYSDNLLISMHSDNRISIDSILE